MDTNRDVILDLLPLYLANEARPGTRQFVMEYLVRDPALAEQARRQADADVATGNNPPPELELRALARTRRRLLARQWLFGIACFFTALSLSTRAQIDSTGVHRVHLVLTEYPVIGIVMLAIVSTAWIAYFRVRRTSF